MKRTFSILSVVLLAVLVLSACGTAATPAAPAAAAPTTAPDRCGQAACHLYADGWHSRRCFHFGTHQRC